VTNAQGQLNNAVAQLNNAQNNLRNVQGQVQQAQGQIEQIRRQAEFEAQRTQQELSNRVSQWQQYLSQAQNTLAGIQNRLDNIIRYELPRSQNDLAALESRRPGAVSEVQAAEQALAGSSAAFESYKASVNYDAIEGEANRTAGVVSQIQNTIAGFQQGVRSRQNLIVQQTALRDGLNKRIKDTNAVIAQKQARLADVNTALAAYDVQKAEIQGRIDVAKAELKVISDQYAASLN
jgi:chromosome segregation ATPase